MPTPYVGLKTNTQAPSAAPKPEGTLTQNLPVDGDPPNASTFAQAYKVCADFIDWLMKPQAQLAPNIASAIWGEAIQRFRSAAGHLRYGIDHNGFPAGQLIQWLETWPTLADVSPGAPGSDLEVGEILGGWFVTITKQIGGTAHAQSLFPTATWSGSRYMEIQVADEVNDYTWVHRSPQALFYADNILVMEWSAKIDNNTAESHVRMGFDAEGGATFGSGIWFYTVAGGNWHCAFGNDGVVGGAVASGVTPNTSWHRYRVEWHGENADEGGKKRCLFFIDGTLVANLDTDTYSAANFPDTGSNPVVIPSFRVTRAVAGTTAKKLHVSPVAFRGNTWLNAFL